MADSDADTTDRPRATDFIQAQSMLDHDAAPFREIFPAERAAPQPPDFVHGPIPHALIAECWGPGFEWVHAQGVLELDADMHWPYLLTRGDVPMDFTWANLHAGHLERIWQNKPRGRSEIGPNHVLITGAGHEIFGHWIVDFLPKLWTLHVAGYDLSELRYIVPDDAPRYGLELLRRCGIASEQIVTIGRDDVLHGRFLIPTVVHNGVRGPRFADAARFLRDRMNIAVKPSPIKLLLSRAKASQARAPRNRDTIERLALRAGFSIVYPEQWSLLEQFRLVASASVVLGEYGSALHSTLFAGPGLTVCALRGTGLHPGFIQSAIGSALGQRTGYLFGEHQDHDVPGGFTVSENVLRDYLMSF